MVHVVSRQQRRYLERKERKLDKDKAKGPILIGMPHKEIVGDDKLRERKCMEAVNRELKRYDCVIVPKILLTQGNVQAMAEITAISRKPNA